MSKKYETLEAVLAMEEPPYAKKPEPPKLTVVSAQELSAEVMRERAERANREAAERERAEIERREREHQRRIDRLQAAHWHATESKWHAQQSDRFAGEYRGFHSRND